MTGGDDRERGGVRAKRSIAKAKPADVASLSGAMLDEVRGLILEGRQQTARLVNAGSEDSDEEAGTSSRNPFEQNSMEISLGTGRGHCEAGSSTDQVRRHARITRGFLSQLLKQFIGDRPPRGGNNERSSRLPRPARSDLGGRSQGLLGTGRRLQDGDAHQLLAMIAEQDTVIRGAGVRRLLRVPKADVEDVSLFVVVHSVPFHRDFQKKWNGCRHGLDCARL